MRSSTAGTMIARVFRRLYNLPLPINTPVGDDWTGWRSDVFRPVIHSLGSRAPIALHLHTDLLPPSPGFTRLTDLLVLKLSRYRTHIPSVLMARAATGDNTAPPVLSSISSFPATLFLPRPSSSLLFVH
jgi:hypothetical protein